MTLTLLYHSYVPIKVSNKLWMEIQTQIFVIPDRVGNPLLMGEQPTISIAEYFRNKY